MKLMSAQKIDRSLKLTKKNEEIQIRDRKNQNILLFKKVRSTRCNFVALQNASELTDGQISKLVEAIRNSILIRKRSYWNFSNLKPRDPVISLCTQESFQKAIEKLIEE